MGILWPVFFSALPEGDLWWMVPSVADAVSQRSPVEVVRFLLSPAPLSLGQPILKIYLFLGTVLGGFSTGRMVLVSLLFHAANALLLAGVSRQLGSSRMAAAFSALIYLTLFAHFHAYLWPTAFQHLFAVPTVLGMLSLYLKAEAQIQRGDPRSRWTIAGMFLLGAVSSLQRSAVILTCVLLLTHILVCSEHPRDRWLRYRRWVPLFLLFSIYPCISLATVGDVIINYAIVRIPLPVLVRVSFLMATAAMGWALLGWFIRKWAQGVRIQKKAWALGLVGMGALWLLLSLRDRRQILLPYNALVPWNTLFVSFLEPLRVVLEMDSTKAHQLIPPQVSLLSLLGSLSLAGIFIRSFVAKNRALVLWLVWYALTLVHLLHQYSSFPVVLPSRYAVYLSPVFSVLFGTVAAQGLWLFFKRVPLTPFRQQAVLAGVLALLCVPNLWAIRLGMFRGKMVNTLFVYEDLRAAQLIKEDLLQRASWMPRGVLCVSNVVPMPFQELDHSGPDPLRYDNFRWMVAEVFQESAPREVRVNPSLNPLPRETRYLLQEDRILDAQGRPIDPFTQQFEQGLSSLVQNRPQEAVEWFDRAIETRPFLLRYLLGPQPLVDIRWITRGLEMREWIGQIFRHWAWRGAPFSKTEVTFSLLHKELSDGILAFFFSSYLKNRLGDSAGSRETFRQIWLLERNPEALCAWIGSHPVVRADPAMGRFLQNFHDPEAFGDPLPWRKDDFGFGRFLVRFFFHWDISSGWDRSRGTLVMVPAPRSKA